MHIAGFLKQGVAQAFRNENKKLPKAGVIRPAWNSFSHVICRFA
jgi:hypothetical protein